jgi:TolB-like protein
LALRQYEKCKEILVRELGIAPDRETTELHKRIGTAPTDRPLPSKPSIAVLPFNNMSGDADQEHFADALTEDITTELSRYHDLFVISSHSAFSFKGKAGDVRQVARQLGVRYILHGSVRWAEGRVRVSPQLIDAHSGGQVWAERCDGKVEDIFDLQDELTAKTAAAVGSGILAAEIEAAKRQRPANLDAYGLYAQGLGHWMDVTRAGLAEARNSFAQAIDLDPRFSNAHACLGWVYCLELIFVWAEDPAEAEQKSFDASRRAVELDPNNETAHALLAFVLLFRREHELAAAEVKRALDLNPNLAFGYCVRSFVNVFSGRHQEGLADGRAAIRLSPLDTFMVAYENIVAFGANLAGDYETAVEVASATAAKYPDFIFGHMNLAAACGQLGQIERANKALKETLRVTPDLAKVLDNQPLKVPADLEHLIEGLRKAGWEG